MNSPTICKIIQTQMETPDIKTLFFSYSSSVEPGQFFMIWIPGVDEIPMSVSSISKKEFGITVKRIGEATKALFDLDKNAKIGVRGPYGNTFDLSTQNILFVGGGSGAAMLAPAIELARQQNKKATVVLGAKTKKELIFIKRLKKTGATVHVATDDGSEGFHGNASSYVVKLLKKNSHFESIITCGPELMMHQLLQQISDIPFQASLERYMKCAIGLCGQCCVGKGMRVCKEGTIFTRDQLQSFEDFGRYTRDASGQKIWLRKQ